LPLSAEALAEVAAAGCSGGPVSAHAELVERGVLEWDAGQASCAQALQDLWLGLKSHREARERWLEEHGRWRSAYTEWRNKHEEWERHRRKADEAEAAPPEPLEPTEPPEPSPASYGCYVWGGVGGGKSLLMDLLVDCCGEKAGLNRAVRRVHFHEFMHGVHQSLHLLRQEGRDRTTRAVAQQVAQEAQLLAFDEFQVTNISDALIVETLFDALFAEGVVVVMTSNRPPQDLYRDGLNRHLAIPQFLALLERRGVAFHQLVAARDFRAPLETSEPALEEASSNVGGSRWRDFFCKPELGEGGDELLSTAFAGAARLETGRGRPEEVPIAWGRKLKVSEVAGGVGRFTFSQLCAEALNADDYLLLARRFHTLVIADVPRFSLAQHNEARRFTNLVDCLYERHARLIVTADAPPEEVLASMEGLSGILPRRAGIAAEEGPHPDGEPAARRGGAPSATPAEARGAAPQPQSMEEAVQLAARGPNDAAPGNDEQSTGSGVAGVMAGAVGSLQESGFAARRATSRLLHMQTAEYLAAHRRQRRVAA